MRYKFLSCAIAIGFLLPVTMAPIARCDSPSSPKEKVDKSIALISAASEGDMQSVERIARNHPELINAQPPTTEKGLESHYKQWSALHWAVKRNDHAMAEFLMKHGADPNGKLACEHRPLGMTRDERMAKLLIDAGANVNAVDALRRKPLDEISEVLLPGY